MAKGEVYMFYGFEIFNAAHDSLFKFYGVFLFT